MNDVFQDLVVVELASALAGPSAGMFFAELGAKVIKIENGPIGGDVTRRWKLKVETEEDPYSAYYHCTNWGKQSLMLDLKTEADQSMVHQMVCDADIVISNFRSDSAASLKMDYHYLKSINPQIIYGSITAYGVDDPRPGFDALMQAETGWMSINGPADGLPTKMPVALIDLFAGHQLKQGILVAILKRQQTNEGSHVTVSLYDASLASFANQSSAYLNLGVHPVRQGSAHPSIAPYGDIVETGDGTTYILAVGTDDQFQGLCEAIGLSEMKSDPRFISNLLRQEHRKDLMSALGNAVSKMTSYEFEQRCDDYNVPIGPIKELSDVLGEEAAQSLILEEVLEDGRVSRRVKTAVFRMLS
ncbi:MAG: crotonobetainyl-CoA:carnitine CoA-transferase CaiB-like acyl-CoA transferase [Saprospiraceae bacterium]|jgi:crotonobetainyl-CoA:carnitine CoA-transferase CaiB-like acyl-CoA transferase